MLKGKDAFFNISTTFVDTDLTDNATIALGWTGATGALVAAVAISSGTSWDTKSSSGTTNMEATLIEPSTTLTEATPNTRTQAVHGTDRMAEMIHVTADSQLLLTTAVDTVDAGTLDLWVSYVVSRQIA